MNLHNPTNSLDSSVACYEHTMCGDDCIEDCPHYRVKPELYQTCHYEGNIWTIVFIDGCLVHLTSLDGKQFKRNVHASLIQPIEESDGYPEE